MTKVTANQPTTSRTISEAPIPPNIIPEYSFAGKPPLRFDMSGALSPASKKEMAKIDWDNLQRPAQSKFSDVHCHMHQYDGTGHVITHVVKAAEEIGIDHFTLTPIPTTLVSTKNDQERFKLYELSHHCGEHYYVPMKLAGIEGLSNETIKEIKGTHELRVDASVDDNLLHQVCDAVRNGDIEPKHLDKMDLALTGIHLGSPRVTKDILQTQWRAKNLSDDLAEHIKNSHGPEAAKQHRLRMTLIGEVTLNKELVEKLYAGKTQANLKANIAPTREAMRLAGVMGMPWVLHCDVDKPESLKAPNEKGKPATHLEDVKSLLRSCPNTEIIWAHAGGLGRFVIAGENHVDEMRKLMEDPTLSHVKLDISWSQVAKQLTQSEETVGKWAQLLCDFKGRILFGSDTLTPQTNAKWTETYDMYKEKLIDEMNKIDPSATDLILKGNYKKVIVAARPRVDAFVDHVLPEIILGMQNIAGVENVDVEALKAKRDEIFAEKKATHPELNAVIEYYASRDKELPEVVLPAHRTPSEAGTSSSDEEENLRDELGRAKNEIQNLRQDNAALKLQNEFRKKQIETRNTNIADLMQQLQTQGTAQNDVELQNQLAKSKRKHKWIKGAINAVTTALPVKERMANYKIGSGRVGDPLLPRSAKDKDSAPAQQPIYTTRGQRLDQLGKQDEKEPT